MMPSFIKGEKKTIQTYPAPVGLWFVQQQQIAFWAQNISF